MSCHYSFGGQKRKRWLTFKSSPSAPQTSSAVLPSCPADTTHGRCACFRRRFVKFWGADHSALGVSALARLHGLISDRDRQTVFRPQRGEEMRARGGRRRRSDAAVTWLLCPTARGGSGDFVLPRLHPILPPPPKKNKIASTFPSLGSFPSPSLPRGIHRRREETKETCLKRHGTLKFVNLKNFRLCNIQTWLCCCSYTSQYIQMHLWSRRHTGYVLYVCVAWWNIHHTALCVVKSK